MTLRHFGASDRGCPERRCRRGKRRSSCGFSTNPGKQFRPVSLQWPPNQALPTFPQAVHLDAADLTALDGDPQHYWSQCKKS